jgi:hypothetical protein
MMLAKTLEPMTYIARKPPACKVKGVAVQIFGLISNIVGSNTADAATPLKVWRRSLKPGRVRSKRCHL